MLITKKIYFLKSTVINNRNNNLELGPFSFW